MRKSFSNCSKQDDGLYRLVHMVVLCIAGALTLTGCETGNAWSSVQDFFSTSLGKAGRGCKLEDLYGQLQIDGKTNLTSTEVSKSGVQLCQNPWGLGKECNTPLPRVLNNLDMMCPFLFNVWELPESELYGRGEAIQTRQRQVIKCQYSADRRVEPRWCFTDWCKNVSVNCFTSEEAAKGARPSETNGKQSALVKSEDSSGQNNEAPPPELGKKATSKAKPAEKIDGSLSADSKKFYRWQVGRAASDKLRACKY
jgi:hypothetical protein